MKIKTAILEDDALDWAVTLALGLYSPAAVPPYSTTWALVGPIIDREGLTVGRQIHKTEWSAEAFDDSGMSSTFLGFGPTPIISALRCFVTSKLGEEVDIPMEIFNSKRAPTLVNGVGAVNVINASDASGETVTPATSSKTEAKAKEQDPSKLSMSMFLDKADYEKWMLRQSARILTHKNRSPK